MDVRKMITDIHWNLDTTTLQTYDLLIRHLTGLNCDSRCTTNYDLRPRPG